MVILLAHTFHAIQPLDVSCFKPFKFVFKEKKNNIMVKTNHLEPYKVTIARQVDKTFDKSLSKQNILNRFKAIGVWPLNLRAMDDKPDLVVCIQ